MSDKDFVGCTVASRGFLAHARVLADSFFEHHPQGRFAVLIPDDPDGECSMDERVEVMRPLDLGIEPAELHRMALLYSIKELSCAMKGRVLAHLVGRGETGVLLDGDVRVYGDLSPVAELAHREGLVLSTHSPTPHGTPDGYPPMVGHAPRMVNAVGPEQMAILAGTYNTGIVAATSAAIPFMHWWNERTARYCFLEPRRGLFQEQGWTALAPSFFDCRVLREPGWNVSGFHLRDSDVTWHDERPLIDGAPLRLFHFITFDASDPQQLSGDEHMRGVWPPAAERPGAMRLCRDYAAALLAAGLKAAQSDTSHYDLLADGTPVDLQMRTAYAEALLEHEAGRGPAPPNPFDEGDPARFLRWLAEPVDETPASAGLSRYLLAVHTRLAWVWGSFKEVPGEDTERFLGWLPHAVRHGDLEVPARWLRELPAYGNADPAVAALERQYRDLLDVIESIRSSRSWRLTAPLRAVGRRRRHAQRTVTGRRTRP